MLHQWRREPRAVGEQAEALMILAMEQGFTLRLAQGQALHGWALATQGQGQGGIDQIRRGFAAARATGDNAYAPYILGLLAEAYGVAKHPAQGLNVLAEATAILDSTESRWYEAELYRLKGVLLLKREIPDAAEAETCFHKALDVARHQQAKSWELRASTSLARLWQSQGKHQEAYDLLAPVYGWFTEGFDTADLKEARALLDELG